MRFIRRFFRSDVERQVNGTFVSLFSKRGKTFQIKMFQTSSDRDTRALPGVLKIVVGLDTVCPGCVVVLAARMIVIRYLP